MSNNSNLSLALADVATGFADQIAGITKFAGQIDALELGGFSVNAGVWKLRYRDDFDVSRDTLPKLRKIVGRLQVVGKSVPNDFDRTKEVIVTVRPMSKDFDMLRFTYRSPFRGGGKCHVEKIVSTTNYQTIVCKV
jgi:hypothetical protein